MIFSLNMGVDLGMDLGNANGARNGTKNKVALWDKTTSLRDIELFTCPRTWDLAVRANERTGERMAQCLIVLDQSVELGLELRLALGVKLGNETGNGTEN